ncbi:MAG: S-adenosylmethionine decarboxylase, partial [Candidatus Brockarchaeota archaeon]|nr:S-adenosylmethionine decarboxylase [Candidatus Brockarchaeota archaeon]
SGVTFYSWNPHKFFTLDIYSCKAFDTKLALEYVKKKLKCPRMVWERIKYDK